MKTCIQLLFVLLLSNTYGQQTITGTFAKASANANCGCSTLGILKYKDSKGLATSTYVCFDSEPGDHYELFPGETITVKGVFKSAICSDGISYRNFNVSSSLLPERSRQMIVPEFLKQMNN